LSEMDLLDTTRRPGTCPEDEVSRGRLPLFFTRGRLPLFFTRGRLPLFFTRGRLPLFFTRGRSPGSLHEGAALV